MKIRINKSRLSLLISGMPCLNLLKNNIYKQMKSSQNIQRLAHTKYTSCSSDFVLNTFERASDLKMLTSFPFFVCLSFVMSET
jgi:spore germination protein GerM